MDKKTKVAVIVGSLRKGSYSRMVAKAVSGMNARLDCEIAEIGQLQHFNQDLEQTPSAEWKAFKERIQGSDAVLFVTPEYNRSIPGVLKNAIDVASRPYGQSAWAKKPAAVLGVTPGALGAFGAANHLRQSLAFLDMPTLQQPEAYLSGVAKFFDEGGKLTNADTEAFLRKFMDAFAAWIDTTRAKTS
ncbi:Quinone reductase [Usitatibacter rugosus]|uniref:Quinone reductase n=1 Tax=Usitatibacter rugosus TaxID=2732067 RepID=A0A6M4H010_9PROT|nr:NAD(P)H-dependent oxidoreductase [Usitatibacter rugosus]QJR12064.1 Quinone reductase [Usitatibacter rugosus]